MDFVTVCHAWWSSVWPVRDKQENCKVAVSRLCFSELQWHHNLFHAVFLYMLCGYVTGAYLHSANCADNTPQRQIFLSSLVWCCMHTVETCMPSISILMVTREPYKGILRLPDGNRPENLSLFHSLTCKNNVLLDYYGVWRTYTVSFAHS